MQSVSEPRKTNRFGPGNRVSVWGKMTDLTDMELLARIDMTRAAITESETNLEALRMDLNKLLTQLATRESEDLNNPKRHLPKLRRLYNFILDFTCSRMPKKTASYRFVPVPTYREACGMAKPDPLEFRIDEDDEHMSITFFVSNDRLRNFVENWWQKKFRNMPFIAFYTEDA
jgi:hypothetical protein